MSDVTPRDARTAGATTVLPADDQPIDLLRYVRRLGRYLKPAAIVGLLAAIAIAVVMGIGGGTQTEYNTKAHVMLQPTWTTSNDAIAESNLVSEYMRTYVALGDSDTITNEVSKAVSNGKYTPQQIAEMMTVYWGGGSLLLAVQVSAPNHADSLAIAQAGAEALVKHQADLVNMPTSKAPHLALVQNAFDATPATSGGTSSKFSGILPGIAGGIVVTLLVALLLEWLAARRARRAARRNDPASGTSTPSTTSRS